MMTVTLIQILRDCVNTLQAAIKQTVSSAAIGKAEFPKLLNIKAVRFCENQVILVSVSNTQ